MSLKVMADNQIEITAKQDGALYNCAMGDADFIIKGLGDEFAMSQSGLIVTVGSGEAIIHGRHVTAYESNQITLPANESGYLSLRIDLSQQVGQEVLLYATPTLTHQEINWDGQIYDFPLATFTTQSTAISQFEDTRKVIKSAIEEALGDLDALIGSGE